MKLILDDIPDPLFKSQFDAIGVRQYCILYQNQVNRVHNSTTTGTIDVQEIINHLEAGTANEGGAKFADADIVFLDFEAPFTWVMMVGSSYSNPPITYSVVKNSMVAALTALRAKYPTKKWGYYNSPSVPSSVNETGTPIQQINRSFTPIELISEEQRLATVAQMIKNFKAVATASNVLSAGVYQEDVQLGESHNRDFLDQEKAKMAGDVMYGLTKTKDRLGWISPVFFKELLADPNEATAINHFKFIPFEELAIETLLPGLSHNMNGFIMWTNAKGYINFACSELSSDEGVRSDQIALRTAFKTNLIGELKLSETEENKLWLTPTLKTNLQSAYTWYILKLCKRILSVRV